MKNAQLVSKRQAFSSSSAIRPTPMVAEADKIWMKRLVLSNLVSYFPFT